LGQAEPIRSESKQKYQQGTEHWQENNETKEIGGKIKWDAEHDEKIQYFPHCP
jgi:hypothetical protein